MGIYDVDGLLLSGGYDMSGDLLDVAYDIEGNAIDGTPDIPVEPLTWNMSATYKQQVLNVLDAIDTYKQSNQSAYALCQFNDVHEQFTGNEPNFIDYNKGYKVIDRMLFLGDMVTNPTSQKFTNAVAFMNGASASKKMVAIGNHEYFADEAVVGDPESLYKPVINVECSYMSPDILIYYHDDIQNNVRYIALNNFYQRKTGADNAFVFDTTQAEWMAGVLESAGSKDIIIITHAVLSPFLGLESGNTLSSSATIQNYQMMIDMIVAYKNRGTYTVTVDGTSHTHDFSSCTGNFVMYTCGHYHALGYGDFGFNMFTCPTLGTTYGGSHKGFVFYLIDKALRTIKVIQCSSQLTDYISFDYTY